MTLLQETLDGIQPEIVVSVGTDLHLFNRLIDWIDDWLDAQEERPTCLVQYGSSRSPRNALGVSRMSRDELLGLYAGAKVVVVQGGPGSILDAREVGALPIAVPRWPEKQEVVDRHQIAFTETMEQHGEAIAVHSEEQLRASLDAALENPEHFQKSPRISDPKIATGTLEREIGKILQEPRKLHTMKRVLSMVRSRRIATRDGDESGELTHERTESTNCGQNFASITPTHPDRHQP